MYLSKSHFYILLTDTYQKQIEIKYLYLPRFLFQNCISLSSSATLNMIPRKKNLCALC